MDPEAKEVIKSLADQIRDKIKGGKLYGEPIDMSDQDSILVAAYLAGEENQRGKTLERDRYIGWPF